MFCSQCGKPTKQGQNFCRFCGAPLQQNTASSSHDDDDDSVFEPVHKKTDFDAIQGSSDLQQNLTVPPKLSNESSVPAQELSDKPPMKMAWYNFLIYFFLYVSAFAYFRISLSLLMGNYYTNKETTEYLYNMYGNLRTLDIIMTILSIATGAWGIFTRFRLAHYCKNGPLCLNIYYGCTVAWSLIFIYGLSSITGLSPTELAGNNLVSSLIIGIILIVTNTLYFQKRKHLFTK